MKKRILPLLLALLLIGSLTTAFAAGGSTVAGVFDVRTLASGYKLTVGGTLSGGVYTNVTSYTLTTPAMKNGDQVAVMIASGADTTPTTANIKYINQQTATSSALTFKLLPGSLSDGTYTVYVSSTSMDLTKVAAFQKGAYVPFVIGTTSYDSLDAALKAAKSGETVKMQSDAEASSLVYVSAGVTLDLNGHTLTSKESVMSPAGSMIDSSNGLGLLKISRNTKGNFDHVLISSSNKQTSVYDKNAGGYRFFDVSIYSYLQKLDDTTKAKVWCKPVFTNYDAYRLLAEDGTGDGMVVEVGWTASGSYRFKFDQTLMKKLYQAIVENGIPASALWVTFVGLDSDNASSDGSSGTIDTSIIATPRFETDTGILHNGSELTLK